MDQMEELFSFLTQLCPCSSPALRELDRREIALWKEVRARAGAETTEQLQDVLSERIDLLGLHSFRLGARLFWDLLR